MIVNFIICKINQGTHKLTHTSTLIKKKLFRDWHGVTFKLGLASFIFKKQNKLKWYYYIF
jgi:hypothetical protein